MSKANVNSTPKTHSSAVPTGEAAQLLQLAQIRAEKCELKEAREAYTQALAEARKDPDSPDLRLTMEALSGLLRLAGEALDIAEVKRLEKEIDALVERHPKIVPPMVWYCKAVIARHNNEPRLAQRNLLRYLRTVRQEIMKNAGKKAPSQFFTDEEMIARGWIMLAIVLWQRGRMQRSKLLAEELLKRLEAKNLRGVNGMIYILMGTIYENKREFAAALSWFQKAHAAFMGEHSWYFHLYVLYAYARLARHQKNYAQAYWYLDLMEKALVGPEFGVLQREIESERSKLADDAVDLLIDSRACTVKTRDGGEVSLGKQYVLLQILEALSSAHDRSGADRERGLSKAEIIEKVWRQRYRPEAHDNKLYYNINRLRKLIEPDVHRPRYLLNWREGYRLAPDIKIQFIGALEEAKKSSSGGNTA